MFAEPVNERENALTLALHMCQIRLSRGGSLYQVYQVFQQGKGKPCPYMLAT
jgi:hypothetical protein